MRNQVYVHYRPLKWQTEKGIQWNENKKDIIKPDAIMEYNQQAYFIEIDHTQNMKVNKEKILKYVRMKESISNFPIILYVTVSEYRQKELRAALNKVKSDVLLYNDLK